MKRFFILCLVSTLIFINSQAPTALGCAINPGDRWYSVRPEITNNPLSDLLGVSFSENGSLITFTNKGLTSDLYIASKDTDGKYPGYDETRRSYRPVEEIIGHDFDPNVLFAVNNDHLKGMYRFYGGWDNDSFQDRSTENSGTAALDQVLDSTDNYKTKQVIGDNRPEGTLAPEPDHQTMYAFYQGKQYNIELALNYTLNENYNPHKTANSCEGESEALHKSIVNAGKRDWLISSATLAVVSIIFIVFILSPWIYSRSTKKKYRSLPKDKTRK